MQMVVFSSPVFAQAQKAQEAEVKTHNVEKYKYLLKAPAKWQTQTIEDQLNPIKLSLLSEDKKISLIVMVSDKDEKTTAADFLKAMESSRRMKSKLKPAESKASADLLKSSTATEGARALYEFTGKGPNFPVEQKTVVLKKGKLMYALSFAYPKSEAAKHAKAIEDVEKSFQAL